MFRIARIILIFACLEIVSLASFVRGELSLPLLAGLGAATFLISLKNPKWGIYILFGELFVGSRGHLLEYRFLSLRLVVFTAVFLAWGIGVIRERKFSRVPGIYWLLLVIIGLGAIHGYLRGNGLVNVFQDMNGYLYLAILPAVLAAVKTRQTLDNFFEILKAAIIVIAAKTLILFLWFSFGWQGVATLYHWIIDQDIGEITGQVGTASRIFMQSQFWALMGVFIMGLKGERGVRGWLIIAAALFSVIMSLSRSFWLGGIAGALFAAVMLLFYFHAGIGRVGKLAAIIILIIAAETGALFAFSKTVGSSQAVGSRAQSPIKEAAGGARLLLLPELLAEIKQSPLIGKGFGEEVTYASYLPDRVTAQNPEGKITSYAFEWGYLDTVLKIGFLGLLVYLFFIAHIFRQGWSNFQTLGILSGLVALVILNITTPYLNHPLGIGYLIFAYSYLSVIRKENDEAIG